MPVKTKSESQIQKEICQYLTKQGYIFWRFSPQTYNAKLGIHLKHEFIPSGLSDIMVLHPGDTKFYPTPCLIGLEVKKKKGGKASAGQLLMQRRFRLVNHVYEFVTSVDDVKALGL